MEGMNALKPALVKHILLVCVWLLTCCTRAASEDYRRIMWVSTTGEDSPQCIHAMPASDLLPIPQGTNEACGSLNYALRHIQNETAIIITCGVHVLKPVGSLLNGKPLMNITALNLMGVCENSTGAPKILCADRANLAFYNSDIVVIENLEFQGCAEQLKHSDSLRLSESSTLYFQNCRETGMLHLIINITGPYGRGISIIRNDTTITHGQIVVGFVGINHLGNHGSGINLEVLTSSTRDASLAKESIHLTDIHVKYINIHPNYTLTTTFTGINISVMGDGEKGDITLSQIFINTGRSTRSNSISVVLHDSVRNYTITFRDIRVTERCCSHTYVSDTAKSDANNSTVASIKIELRGNSTRNNIRSFNARVYECRVVPGSAFSIEVTDHSEENAVWLQNVLLLGSNGSEVYSRRLQVVVTGWAKRNIIKVNRLTSLYSRAHWRAGSYIEFHEYAMENSVQISNSYFIDQHALIGGDFAEMVECRVAPCSALYIAVMDHSEENVVRLVRVSVIGASISEVQRRGLQVILTGWAQRNKIVMAGIESLSHSAYWGAGGYFEFSGHAMANSVLIRGSHFHYNHAHSGGGAAVVCKDLAAHNTFHLSNTYVKNNSAELGGGVHFIMQDSSNNNTIYFLSCFIFNNTAHCGGGVYICIKDTSVASKVELLNSFLLTNTLIPSEKYNMMGGGVHVEFSTVSATFRTNNTVGFTLSDIFLNSAGQGVGGGISVLYKHSRYQGNNGDSLTMNKLRFHHNKAVSGSACAFQSLPIHGKRLFTGVRMIDMNFITSLSAKLDDVSQSLSSEINGLFQQTEKLVQAQMKYNPSIISEVQSTNAIFAKSVQVTVLNTVAMCGASSQGIYALNSEIVFPANSKSHFFFCVATLGGAIALHGESYVRVGKNTTVELHKNYAFQRGGAIYASSAPAGVVPASNCFLQYDQDWEENSCSVIFDFHHNNAKIEGKSVYASDIRDCISERSLKNITSDQAMHHRMNAFNSFARRVSFSFIDVHCQTVYNTSDGHTLFVPMNISQMEKQEYLLKLAQREIMSGPNHVSIATVGLSKPLTMHFIPGKQKRLPYTHAKDEFGNNIRSVFNVVINKMDDSLPVEVDLFSRYTADFTVILHGIPQQHGMANHSFPSNTSNTSAVVRPPQLVLQSVDNTDLLLVMNIELQCCPPGYVFQYGSRDMGTCHCGVLSVTGIADCNESHPEKIGAVLKRDHWAGYLPSNDQHSCDGRKFFTGPCPSGYCQTQQIMLQEGLHETVCNGSNRYGLLCGDCLEGNSIAVNFNGIRPVCVSCEEGLSKVGILVWILSEWVPMLAFMLVLMLFNIDLVSGRFNSFLLFAQLLAISTIRGDAELGPVHNALVRIYRFLYGMWNLDFFGVLIPPHCLTPHAHLTLLQTLLLHYSIGLFPLTVAITLTVLERSAEKWICCHRVDQCLRRMRQWKAKYSDGMFYDRALPAFVILGFTRFLVSSSYILVHQTITGEDGERKVVVWWQGSVPYGSIQHIAYFIPAIVILLVFVLLPSFLLLTLPIGPQLFGRLIIAVPPLRKLQKMQTFCSNVYTDRWVYHFVNVFQGCYKEQYRSFSSFYLFHRIVHLLVAVFIPRAEDALRIQIFLVVSLLLLISTLQPYNSCKLNTLDTAILGNLALILILSLHITDLNTPIGTRQFFASIQMILIYLPLLYPGILLGKKVYLKCRQLRCCQKQEEQREDNEEPLLEAPAERLGNLVLITELHAGVSTSEYDDSVTEAVSINESRIHT